LCQTKDYKIGYCYFCDKHAALMSRNKDMLAQNQNNVSEWRDNPVCWSRTKRTSSFD